MLRVAYFVPSFGFENRSYVDIMTVFKAKNRRKRSSLKCKVTFGAFLSMARCYIFLLIHFEIQSSFYENHIEKPYVSGIDL